MLAVMNLDLFYNFYPYNYKQPLRKNNANYLHTMSPNNENSNPLVHLYSPRCLASQLMGLITHTTIALHHCTSPVTDSNDTCLGGKCACAFLYVEYLKCNDGAAFSKYNS